MSQWFSGKELAFAFSVNLSVARLITVVVGVVEPLVAGASSVEMALWVGTLT